MKGYCIYHKWISQDILRSRKAIGQYLQGLVPPACRWKFGFPPKFSLPWVFRSWVPLWFFSDFGASYYTCQGRFITGSFMISKIASNWVKYQKNSWLYFWITIILKIVFASLPCPPLPWSRKICIHPIAIKLCNITYNGKSNWLSTLGLVNYISIIIQQFRESSHPGF